MIDLAPVQKALLTAIGSSERPSESRFAARLARNPELLALRFRRAERILRLVGGEGRALLDAGSGIALNAVLSILAGASEVHAVELNPHRLEVARRLVAELGLGARVHLLDQDILTFELPPGSLGGMYSNEFLEHIVDSPEYHRRAARWLAPGGRVYGRTGANGGNWLYHYTYSRKWQRAERGVYQPARRNALRALLPEAPAETLEKLARATRGHGPAELAEAARAWKNEGRWPQPLGRVPKNPETGVYYERLRGPRELVAEMAAAGLRARVIRPDYRNAFTPSKLKRLALHLAGAALAATHPVSLCVAPWLEVLGEKP
ncbi:MAG: class I SAM-dependent methyltransferase [Thermoanaerobaculia bacterium]